MSVGVITDSNSGIFESEAAQNGMFVVPMPIVIDGQTYYEGIDIELEQFVELQDGGAEISTSQPAIAMVMDTWKKGLKEYDEIVYIPMTSGLSGSCSTAIAFSAEFDGKVVVVDNHRISVPQRASVYQALDLSKKGYSANQIKEILEEDAYNTSIYITVNTLEHLKKSGRVTPAGAAIGDLFHVKPVLTIQGEQLDAFAKVRGIKKAKAVMKEALIKDVEERFHGDIENLVIATAYTYVDKEDIEEGNNEVKALFPTADFQSDPLPLSIACHTGKNAFGLGVYKKLNK